MALLGLKKNQNLFVDNAGKWIADYVPAYARRYPFILAIPDPKKNQYTVCIDESYPGFNTAKEGQPLFNAKGEDGPVLKQAVDFLKDYQSHVRLTEAFCKNLADMEILEPMQANVSMKSGQKFAIAGFQAVSRAKLKELAPKKLVDLAKSDQLELIYCHLQSLSNINNLTRKLSSADPVQIATVKGLVAIDQRPVHLLSRRHQHHAASIRRPRRPPPPKN